LEDLKRGIRGRLRNSSPLVSLLDNLNKKKFINLIKLTFQILNLPKL